MTQRSHEKNAQTLRYVRMGDQRCPLITLPIREIVPAIQLILSKVYNLCSWKGIVKWCKNQSAIEYKPGWAPNPWQSEEFLLLPRVEWRASRFTD